MSGFVCASTEEAELRRAQKIRSKAIDDEILREKRDRKYHQSPAMILLGPSQSGKSTIMKQFEMLKFGEDVYKERITVEIKSNVKEIVMTVIKAMPVLNPPIALELPENEARVKYILEVANKSYYDFPAEFYDHCMKLWEDKGVMECYSRSNEYQLMDCASYFMNPEKLRAITNPNYSPNNDDFLHCQVKKKAIAEYCLDQTSFNYTIISQQQSRSYKWIQSFNVIAILFVVACDSYNLFLQEDPSKNCLEEALEMFENVWNDKWLKNLSVILLLNKQDKLRAKVLEGQFKIEAYFPEYSTYQLNSHDMHEPGEDEEVRRAKGFIRDLFVKVAKASPDNGRSLYTQFTSAFDTDILRKVFNDCRDIIQRIHLRQYELL